MRSGVRAPNNSESHFVQFLLEIRFNRTFTAGFPLNFIQQAGEFVIGDGLAISIAFLTVSLVRLE